jgi:hypothetical protein
MWDISLKAEKFYSVWLPEICFRETRGAVFVYHNKSKI